MPGDHTLPATSQAGKGLEEPQLSAKIKSIKAQIENINTNLTEERLNSMDLADLLVRLDYVDDLYSQLEQASLSVEEGCSSSTCEFLTTYFCVKAKIKRTINTNHDDRPMPRSSTIRQFSIEEPTKTRKTRLPELKIQQFSGSYTEWPDFFAMFNTVIAKDTDLSAIEKFQHLRACLSGAALDTISSLEPNDENYVKAICLLKNRFDNKLLNFQSHIKGIFELKDVEKGSASSLRHLSDKFNAHIRALETMSTKEQLADGLLNHIIASKLDAQTQSKWEEDLQNDKLPTLLSFTDFLAKRCRTLENLQGSMTAKLVNRQVSKKPTMRNVLVASGTPTQHCNFCEATDHYITSCKRFNNLSPIIRYKEVKKLNLCLNCLRKGHRLAKCKSGACRHCSLKHHSLLHMDCMSANSSQPNHSNIISPKFESSFVSPVQPIASIQSTLVSSLSTAEIVESSNEANVFLATAMVLIKNKYGAFVPCRAILDSASQLNFISSRLLARLQLKGKRSLTSISGIGDGNFVADKSANVLIKSSNGEYFLSFDAVVIPNITGYQPNTNENQFDIPANIKLADPLFNKTGRIDILIGANLFFELMDVGQFKLGNNLPILQKTRLGWVVSGGGVSSNNCFSLATISQKTEESEHESLSDIMKSFWEVENNYDNCLSQSTQDEFCENHFRQHTIRLESGEYSVRLPKNPNISKLGDSYGIACRRFLSLERKLVKFPNVRKHYVNFMNEYLELNHMALVSAVPPEVKMNYLPHHCVHKEESTTTKLRVVFDGSAKTNTGGNSVKEVNEIRHQVTNLLACGKLQIRKWCSNNASILNEIPLSDREEYLKFHDGTDITKTLGLIWDPKADSFIFVFSHVDNAKQISKRSILSTIARFYDPLGLIGPVITKAKICMQTLWKSQLDWDESLPQHLHSSWMKFVSTFSTLHKFMFPRFVLSPDSTVQIHAFCDASLSAYGACIYVKSILNGEIRVNLLCSKSRVAPLKALTIPKLELSAALLLAELLHEVIEVFGYKYEYHCWSDSMVVLSWLRHDSTKFNVFVANRVSRIQSLTKNMLWHHVPSASNPADILSRGATPEELFFSNIWKEGPDFYTKMKIVGQKRQVLLVNFLNVAVLY